MKGRIQRSSDPDGLRPDPKPRDSNATESGSEFEQDIKAVLQYLSGLEALLDPMTFPPGSTEFGRYADHYMTGIRSHAVIFPLIQPSEREQLIHQALMVDEKIQLMVERYASIEGALKDSVLLWLTTEWASLKSAIEGRTRI